MNLIKFKESTWLEPEEICYSAPSRKALAKWPDGRLRRVNAKLPDTFFSIPGWGTLLGERIKGFLTTENGVLMFIPEKDAPLVWTIKHGWLEREDLSN